MTTETITLSSFLLARIAEDEEAAREATPGHWTAYGDGVVLGESSNPEVCRGVKSWNMWHISNHDPARVLAECAAKRSIVEMFTADYDERGLPSGAGGYGEAYCEALQHLAAVHSDHPDYREAWKP